MKEEGFNETDKLGNIMSGKKIKPKEEVKKKPKLFPKIKFEFGRKKKEETPKEEPKLIKEEPKKEVITPPPTEPIKEEPKEEKKVGLTSQLKELNEKLEVITQKKSIDKKLKKKQFKLPFKVKGQLKKLAMKNKVQVLLIQRNRNIKPTIGEIKDGMLIINNETIHDCPMDCVGLWNGKFPTIILPEWDLKPISLTEMYNDTLKNQSLSDPQKIIIRSIEFKESLQPKKMSPKTLIWIFIIGAAGLYILFAQGGG